MKEAVIVSAARTPIGRAFRGAFNNLESPSMSSHADDSCRGAARRG